jgi:hypothetical protein
MEVFVNLHSFKKKVIMVTGLATAIITLHIGIMVTRHFMTGAAIIEPGCITVIALLMGVQNLILALWCYDYIRREERVLELYSEVRHD